MKMNLIIVGDGAVGKTSILQYYCHGKVPKLHTQTLGLDQQRVVKQFEGQDVEVKLWDTAGQEQFSALTR